MTLTEFLLARIAEDEAAARAATPSPWVPGSQGWDDANGHGFIVAPYHELDISDEDAEHVTRWQPARVLAECDAKRQVVDLHRLYEGKAYRETPCCARCTAFGEYPADDAYTDEQNWPCPTLRAVALPYADHPDYDPSWRP